MILQVVSLGWDFLRKRICECSKFPAPVPREMLARVARKHPPNHTIPSYPKLVDFLRVTMAIKGNKPNAVPEAKTNPARWRRQNQLGGSTTKKRLPDQVGKLINEKTVKSLTLHTSFPTFIGDAKCQLYPWGATKVSWSWRVGITGC